MLTQKTSNATYPASQSASEFCLIDVSFIFHSQFYYFVLLEVHFFPSSLQIKYLKGNPLRIIP